MKTHIPGTGVIGTLHGWALAETGVDVTHDDRLKFRERYWWAISMRAAQGETECTGQTLGSRSTWGK